MVTYRRYRRVSRKEQARNSNAFSQQLWHLNEQLEILGIPLDESPLYEDQQSGREDARPGFQQLLLDLQRGDWLIVTRIDRITRDLGFNAGLARRFRAIGIQVFEIQRGTVIDWENHNDWEYFQRAGLDAEMESRRLSARVKRGKRYARAQHKANSFPPYGYRRVDDRYEIDPGLCRFALRRLKILEQTRSYAESVRRIRKRPHLYGGTISVEGLRRWFHNPVLRGHTGYDENYSSRYLKRKSGLDIPNEIKNRTAIDGTQINHNEIVWDTHPEQVLLSDERYRHICALLQQPIRRTNQHRQFRPLSGLLRCGACGGPMGYVARSSPNAAGIHHGYYTCLDAKRKIRPEHCQQRACLPIALAEQRVIAAIQRESQMIAAAVVESVNKDTTETVDPELLRLEQMLRQLEIMGDNPALAPAKDGLRQQIKNHKQKSRQPQPENRDRESAALFKLLATEIIKNSFWEHARQEEKRQVFHGLIRRVRCLATPLNPPVRGQWNWRLDVEFR